MNLTLIGLHLSYSSFSSPFLSLPSSYSSPSNLIAFSNLNFNKHFSSLFRTQFHSQMNSKLELILNSCEMSHFLNQVISITSGDSKKDDPNNNHYGESAYSPTASFLCNYSSFKNNDIPLEIESGMPKSTSGAAIYVSLPFAIVANITHSNFTDNRAPFGGAIFYASEGGSIIITHSIYDYNKCYAGQGAHLFIGTHKTIELQNINFILGEGNTSIYCVADANETIELESIRFYQNEGPIFIDNGATVYFKSCCFTKFTGSGNSLQYIPSDLVSDKDTNCKFFIEKCCINYGAAEYKQLSASEIVSYFDEIGKNKSEGYCHQCRLVPTPSHTMSARVSLACAKEAIIAICCCVFVSILGICIVIGLSRTSGLGESMDHSN